MRRLIINAGLGIVFATLLVTVSATTNAVLAQTGGETLSAEMSGIRYGRRFLRCSERTIRGRFAARTEGTLVNTGPFTAVGVFTFNESGSVTNAATSSTNGVIQSGETTGTYHLNEDCTLEMTIPSVNPMAPPLTFNLVVADRGDQIVFVATRSPAVLSGVGQRME